MSTTVVRQSATVEFEQLAVWMTEPTPSLPVKAAEQPQSVASREFAQPGVSFRCYEERACTVIEATGEIDMAASPLLREVLDSAPKQQLLVDLSQVTFLNSTGVAVLVGVWRAASSDNGCVRLVVPEGAALKVLHITQVDQVMPIHQDLGEALALSYLAVDGGAERPDGTEPSSE